MTGDSYKRYINYQKIKPSRRTAEAAGMKPVMKTEVFQHFQSSTVVYFSYNDFQKSTTVGK